MSTTGETINRLFEQNAQLLRTIESLSQALVEANRAQPHQLAALVPVDPPVTFESQRLHSTEDEEDLEYAHTSGQISREELVTALRSAGFANTDVEIG